MGKLDIAAFCLFLLALGQNMTGVGSDWIGFLLFFAVGAILLAKILNRPRIAKAVPWQLRMLIIVMGFCFLIGISAPSIDQFVQNKISNTIPRIELRVPPPIFPVMQVVRQVVTAPPHSTEKPDVSIALVYPKAFAIFYVDTSNVVADKILGWFAIWDLENIGPDPLPIASQGVDWIRAKDHIGPNAVVSDVRISPLVKPNDRLFGYIGVTCAECLRTRYYWVYSVVGGDGWYAEIPEGKAPVNALLFKALPTIKQDPEKYFADIQNRQPIAAP
jgi:hypothetical protein